MSPPTSIYLILIAQLLIACTEPAHKAAPQPSWDNKHKTDANLAGIEIMQMPEGAVGESNSAYLKGHPAMVLYYFWDGKVRQTGFEANGTMYEDFFWPNKLAVGDGNWKAVDFSFGSDPTFIRHRDPRPTKKTTDQISD